MQKNIRRGVSTLSLTTVLSLFGTAAFAQTPAATSQAAPSDEVVVTGSRIRTNGYTAPTPVTVVTTEQLQRTAPGAIPEGLNQLPQFAGSRSNVTPGGLGNTPSSGNYLNLRNLGTQRNLVLLDGQRLPPTSYEGITDSNIIPQALVQRVEVVTGGASAAYGSDAVSGVINYILDTKYNGLKGQIQYGEAVEFNDARTVKGNIAFGASILNDRVHILGSIDHYQQDGIIGNESRPYGSARWYRTGNGTTTPYKEVTDARFSNASYGTQISTSNPAGTPLRGYQFIPGGLAVPMNLGTPTDTAGVSVGGDGPYVIGRSLTASQDTEQYFLRADSEVAPGIDAFAQISYTDSWSSSISVGSGTQVGDFRIFSDNAFIADSTRAALQNGGSTVTSFIGSRLQADQPPKRQTSKQAATIFVSGLSGKFSDKYDWSLGYSHGSTTLDVGHEGNFDNQRYYAGLDAVKNAQGQIVCRITITNPGVLDGCIPFNIFGNGAPSKAAYDYISQTSKWYVEQSMDIVNANLSGDLLELPAGPLSVAVGAEYRKEDMDQTSNSDPSKSINLTGLRTNTSTFILKYNSTNVGATTAERDVKEAYIEAAFPVLKGLPLFQALDLNAAYRHTDYSTSGGVNTWKVGLSWIPIESVRFRATRSRDIRAPSLNDLFAAPNSGQVAFLDIHTNTNTRLSTTSTGNADLTPELGDTFTGGVVFSPSFLPGLQMSVDYYTIKIEDAIGTPATATIVQDCETSNGAADVCKYIERPLAFSNRTAANFPTRITSIPINQASVEVSGLDYDISYRSEFDWGLFSENSTLDMRLVGGRLYDYLSQSDAKSPVLQTNNSVNNSKNRVNVQLNWRDGPFRLSTQTRFIGPRNKTQDKTLSYAAGYSNDIPAVNYTDVTASYQFKKYGGDYEAYLTVANVFDKQPPLIPGAGQAGQAYPTNLSVYDIFGRFVTVGLRANF
jgi:outer membrane receptor protein involved in Fe transport